MGRFEGQGPLTRRLHGVFMGYQRRVWRTLEVMVEEDGRDVNAGLRFTFPRVAVAAAVEAAEQYQGSFYPFYNLTVEFSPRLLHQGPERLGERRDINGVRANVDSLARQLDVLGEERAQIQTELARVQADFRSRGVDPSALDRINDDIEQLEREIEAAKNAAPAAAPAREGL